MTAFRVGDVVRFLDKFSYDQAEKRVTATREGNCQLDMAGAPWAMAEFLVVLRRPVQTGDMLARFGAVHPVPANATTHVLATATGANGWTHADGTPIEPAEKTALQKSWARSLPGFPGYTADAVFVAGHSGGGGGGPATTASGAIEYTTTINVDAKKLVDEALATAVVARFARALFETDDDVVSFVNRRAENDVSQRRADVMQRCWDRGHAGDSPEWRWYVRAADRAKAMGKVGT